MDALRWVLLVIGAVIFLLIFVISKKRTAGYSRLENTKIEPGFQSTLQDTETTGTNESHFEPVSHNMSAYDDVDEQGVSLGVDAISTQELTDKSHPVLEDNEKLIVLYLVEKHGAMLSGGDIISSLEQAGMNYGDMKIFHYYPDNIRSSKQPVFSIANLIAPGYFEMSTITELETPGLSLFLKLPGPVGSISAFDQMVKVIEKLQGCLPLIVKDSGRNIVSKQMLMHLREEVVEFDRMSTIV